MKRILQLPALLYAALCVLPGSAQAQYEYESIAYPGYAFVQVFGVNDSGDLVGTAYEPGQAAFVYSSMDGSATEIPPIDGYGAIGVLGINDAGTIAGSVLDLDGVTSRAFTRRSNGNVTVFSHPDAVSQTVARAVNNRGLSTGTYDRADGTLGGFLYDPQTETFTDLVPSVITIAQGISSKGDVVGDARFDADPCGGAVPFQRYGWVRRKDGTVTLFQVNGWHTVARGINDAGKVVGWAVDTSTSTSHGFIIDVPETSCANVGAGPAEWVDFPGATFTFPQGITNSDDIVGFYDDGSISNGFLAVRQ